ncbi:MAG: MBL fold metallo-hydrolase [Bacteroidetes bacterium B1(2017)]|nr:MAG: MBL fold metallo-hydrolase [Bacteroidetes bacterium B1(2017)]
MIVEQMYTNCLAQAAYYIESNGQVAIIDPIRDYQVYIDKAEANGAKITHIFETHFHADFVSGHIDLAAKTGAKIVYGPSTQTNFPVHVAEDGEVFKLGDITITLLHTPGHTPESSSFLLKDESNKDYCVFTGDTLFVGDVGRPDLLDGIMTKETLAGMMYHSLKKLTALNSDVIVYPAHGPGSACGKNIGKETFSTIGEQKEKNYALQPMTEAEFIATVTDGITPAPAYFFKDAKLNKQGYATYDSVLEAGLKSLTIEAFKALLEKEKATIIDTRFADFFELGFIPGSLNFGLNGQFAIWAATIVDLHHPIVLVCKPGTEEESVQRLTRVGFDSIKGYLNGGYDTWVNANEKIDMVISISAEEFALDSKHNPKAVILDVRKPSEFASGHVLNATSMQLSEVLDRSAEIDTKAEILVHCAGGYRSMVAASILKKEGFINVKNVWGGYGKIKEEEISLVGPK